MAKKKKKVSSTSVKNPAKHTIDFTGWEDMTGQQFHKLKTDARYFYYEHSSSKDLESCFRRYLKKNKYSKKDVSIITSAYMPTTTGILCKLLETGCPDYNEKENEYWKSLSGTVNEIKPLTVHINERIERMMDEGKSKLQEKTDEKEPTNVISIQDRMAEQIAPLLESFEGFLDDWLDGDVDVKTFEPYNQMISHEPQIKPAHAKLILKHFEGMLQEAKEVVEFKDPDIKEAYGHLAKAKQRKQYHEIFEKIESACNLLIQSGKVKRKPRKPKQVSNEKLVSKVKYKDKDTEYSLVSVNPASIIGATELWVFNTKNRKIGHYVADEYEGPLSVKGSTLQGFDKVKSIQKTLRKPEEQLKEFQSSGKVALRKFMSNLTTKDSVLTGRINGDTILLKVA
jgi:hypothetical protein